MIQGYRKTLAPSGSANAESLWRYAEGEEPRRTEANEDERSKTWDSSSFGRRTRYTLYTK